jgi:hypothetical protein
MFCQVTLTIVYILLHLFTDTPKPSGVPTMQTRQLDNGILNNYATEPPIYPAEYPSPEQQERYKIQGAIALAFVTALIFASITVSAIA